MATIISVPPRASESNACSKGLGATASDGGVGALQLLDLCRGILLAGVDHVIGAEFPRHLELVVLQVDGDHGRALDLGVLHRQVTQAADTEDRAQLRRADLGALDRFVDRHAGAAQRRRVQRVHAVGHLHDVARIGGDVLGVPAGPCRSRC
jgi:hypothetical protein